MLRAVVGRISRIAIWAIFAMVSASVAPPSLLQWSEHEEHRGAVARIDRTPSAERPDNLPSVTPQRNWLLSHPGPAVWFDTPLPHHYFDLRNGRGLSLLC